MDMIDQDWSMQQASDAYQGLRTYSRYIRYFRYNLAGLGFPFSSLYTYVTYQ